MFEEEKEVKINYYKIKAYGYLLTSLIIALFGLVVFLVGWILLSTSNDAVKLAGMILSIISGSIIVIGSGGFLISFFVTYKKAKEGKKWVVL